MSPLPLGHVRESGGSSGSASAPTCYAENVGLLTHFHLATWSPAPGTQPVRPVPVDEGSSSVAGRYRASAGEMSRLFFAAFTLDHLPASSRVTRLTTLTCITLVEHMRLG